MTLLEDNRKEEGGDTKLRPGLIPYCKWEGEFQGFELEKQHNKFCDVFKTLQTPQKKCYTFNSKGRSISSAFM